MRRYEVYKLANPVFSWYRFERYGWYHFKRYDGTAWCAAMVPLRRYYQLSAETEVTSPMEEALENIIFNVRLFSTPEKLAQLKRTIGNFISWNPVKDERKIDAQTMNQFFCLYAALWSRPNVLANASLADFVRQMALWFPLWIPQDTDKKRFGRFTKALSAEQSHWKDENGKLKKVTEWKKFIQESKMKSQKTSHFERVAMEIYLAVNQLVKGW